MSKFVKVEGDKCREDMDKYKRYNEKNDDFKNPPAFGILAYSLNRSKNGHRMPKGTIVVAGLESGLRLIPHLPSMGVKVECVFDQIREVLF